MSQDENARRKATKSQRENKITLCKYTDIFLAAHLYF